MKPETAFNKVEKHGILVVAGVEGGKIHPVTYELYGKACELAKTGGFTVSIAVFGNFSGSYSFAGSFKNAERIIIADDRRLEHFQDEAEALLLYRLIKRYSPQIVLCGATSRGRALMPRTAVLCSAGLTADCTSLELESGTGKLLQTRPAFGGNLMAVIKTADNRMSQMATVRPGVFKKYSFESAAGTLQNISESDKLDTEIIIEKFTDADSDLFKTILSCTGSLKTGTQNLAAADFIVSGGRGMGSAEGFKLLDEFVSLLPGNAAAGASRAAVDAGWASPDQQIGQTGRTVEAEVYLAFGISGQIQHLAGMQSSKFIIAVNRDKNAPLMQIADIAVAGDAPEILAALIRLKKSGA